MPQNIHGFSGPIGLVVLWLVVRYGRRTSFKKETSESAMAERTKHGRAADMMMVLVMIHSFLGSSTPFKSSSFVFEFDIAVSPHRQPH